MMNCILLDSRLPDWFARFSNNELHIACLEAKIVSKIVPGILVPLLSYQLVMFVFICLWCTGRRQGVEASVVQSERSS